MNYEVFTTETFERRTKKLYKKYLHIKTDCKGLVTELKQGDIYGDRLSGFKGLKLYKGRVKSQDQSRGKRGGFRVIYYVDQDKNEIFLLTIYSKSEKENISKEEILKILHDCIF
ncbi:MAG: type II toxin-antitoxin system RelE/ParE family toxin [Candidatus Margulisiibacteriota bacterium]|jgi:mRNA-degrading endonuclease RelE of RelBE toxin-antitoxin system